MWKKLLLAFLVLALTPLGVEFVHRAWLRFEGRPYARATLESEVADILEAARGHFSGAPDSEAENASQPALVTEPGEEEPDPPQIIHPFYGFEAGHAPRFLERDLAKARRKESSYRILITGGSVAAGFGNRAADKLIEVLGRDSRFAGREIVVLGYGVAAFKQPQQLNLLSYLIGLGLGFDAVINLDGFNEVVVSADNHRRQHHPLFPSSSKWAALASGWHTDREAVRLAGQAAICQSRLREQAQRARQSPLLASSLAGTWLVQRLRSMSRLASESQALFLDRVALLQPGPGVVGVAFQGDTEAAVQFSVRNWSEGSISMHALCQARGIAYLHVLQPTLHYAGSKEATAREQRIGRALGDWVVAVAIGYPLLREGGRMLQERGVSFLDATGVFREERETLYYDACHFNDKGNAILAEAIAAAFLDAVPVGR